MSFQRAQEFAEKNNLYFMETSAFADLNVRDVFELLVQEIYNVKSREDQSGRTGGGRVLKHDDPNFNKSSCGCM